MTHRSPFQPLPFCDSVTSVALVCTRQESGKGRGGGWSPLVFRSRGGMVLLNGNRFQIVSIFSTLLVCAGFEELTCL